MKIICINDINRPKQIPIEKWVKKGNAYTLLGVVELNVQIGKLGFILAEIELDESCFPYFYFDSERFAIPEDISVIKETENVDLAELV